MKQTKLMTALLLTLTLSWPTFSSELTDGPLKKPESEKIKDSSQEKSKTDLESWYLRFSLGYAFPHYTGILGKDFNHLRDDDEVSHYSIPIDLGIYWPIKDKLLLGVNHHELYEDFDLFAKNISITQGYYSLSSLYFLNKTIGEGVYLRGDIGLSKFCFTILSLNKTKGCTDFGVGAIGGSGYSYPISSQTRVNLDVNVSYTKSGNFTSRNLFFSAGFLW